jgi:GNAT superfamily N-acetyltransferase
MKIRPFNYTDSDYDSIIAINNAAHPDNMYDVADWKARDENYPKHYIRERIIAEDDRGQIVGFAFYSESKWSYQPGKLHSLVVVHPDCWHQGIGSALYDATLAALTAKNATLLIAITRENQPKGMQFLAKRGFRRVLREPISQLDLTTFDSTSYDPYKDRIAAAGVEVYTGTQLMDRDPNFWRKLYDLDWEIEQDIPAVHPPSKPDFDQFVKERTDPRHSYRLDGFYIAVDKRSGNDPIGAYIGISTLQLDHANPTKLHIGITGISRSHRRQGLGTALKMMAMDFATVYGAIVIETKNEENNPMLQLNIAMGFREVTAELVYEKQLSPTL